MEGFVQPKGWEIDADFMEAIRVDQASQRAKRQVFAIHRMGSEKRPTRRQCGARFAKAARFKAIRVRAMCLTAQHQHRGRERRRWRLRDRLARTAPFTEI